MRVYLLSLGAALLLGIGGLAQQGDDRTVESLLATLQTGNSSAKRQAIEKLGELGSKAEGAVPALTRIVTEFQRGELDELAIVALGKIGPAAKAALPTLHQRGNTMLNGRRESAEHACVAIGRIGAWSPATTRSILALSVGNPAYFAANPDVTLPQLFALLGDDDAKIRLGALYAWRRLAEDHDEDVLKKHPKMRARVVEHAVTNLADDNPSQRQYAADLFRTLVPNEADKIIPVLIRLMHERAITWRDLDHMLSGRGERSAVHDDLRKKALPSLVAAFADASPAVHAELVTYLGNYDMRYDFMRNHVEWLPGAFAHKNAMVRAGGAATARLTTSNQKIVQELRGLLNDPELPARFHAAAALIVHDRNGAVGPVLACVLEGVRQENADMRLDAVRQLRRLGKDAVPATAALLDALSDSNFHVQREAAEILLSLDARHGKRVLPLVQEIFRNQPNDYNRMTEAFVLAKKLGTDVAPIVPDLVALVEAKPMWLGQAADVLGSAGPEGKQAIPALQKRLQEPNGAHATRDLAHVALALAKLGAPDHARATRTLLVFIPRLGRSYLLDSYLPHYPNESVSELTKLLNEPKLRPIVLKTLNQMRDEAGQPKNLGVLLEKKLTPSVKDDLKNALVQLLDDKDLPTKISAMTAMHQFRQEPPVEKLVALVRECVSTNGNHTQALSLFMEGKEPTLVPVIIEEAAKHGDYDRFYSVFSSTPNAIPILLKIAKTASSRQCVQAAWGLAGYSYIKMTDESRAEAMATLLARLPDLKSPARGEVAMAILHLHRNAHLNAKAPPREAVVAVGEYLVDKDVKSSANAAYPLRLLGKNAAPVTEQLRLALDHANAYVRLEAASCLASIDLMHAKEILPLVQKTLEERAKEETPEADGHVGMALRICSILGAEARSVLPRVLEINRTGRAQVAISAGKAAVAIDKDCIPEVAKNLATLLGQSKLRDHMQTTTVHRLLREWGKAAGGADEHLLPLMRQDRDSSRYDVAVTLIMMQGPNAKMGVEPMRRGLRNIGSDGDCSEALHHFALLKSHGKVFLPELRTLLDSPNQYDREEALRAIGAIGPDAKELLPELRRRLENATSESARRNLEDAIKEISRKEHFQ